MLSSPLGHAVHPPKSSKVPVQLSLYLRSKYCSYWFVARLMHTLLSCSSYSMQHITVEGLASRGGGAEAVHI